MYLLIKKKIDIDKFLNFIPKKCHKYLSNGPKRPNIALYLWKSLFISIQHTDNNNVSRESKLTFESFSGYSKIYPDFTDFWAFWAYLGAYFRIFLVNFLCMCSARFNVLILSHLRLKAPRF